jgi:hypothetical protein
MSEPKRPRLEGPPPDGVLKIDEPDIETGGDPDEPRDPDSMPEGVAFMPEHVELAPEHVETMRELEDVQQSLDQVRFYSLYCTCFLRMGGRACASGVGLVGIFLDHMHAS